MSVRYIFRKAHDAENIHCNLVGILSGTGLFGKARQ